MKAKKLPDVPIMFSTDGRPFVSAVAVPTTGMKTGVRYRYTPAKPAKVCVWSQDGEDSFWVPGCVGLDGAWEFTADGPKENSCTYCMRCSGKIKVTR